MEPYSLEHLVTAFTRAKTTHQVLYLPRNSDLRQVAKYATSAGSGSDDAPEDKLKVIHYCMYGASKALCIFLGDGFGESDLS